MPFSSHGIVRRTPARATSSAVIGDDQVPYGATVRPLDGGSNGGGYRTAPCGRPVNRRGRRSRAYTKSEALLRHALAVEASVALVRAALRRGRGVLALRRAPARLRLRDPPHARQASAGRRADPPRGGLPRGADRGRALARRAPRDAARHAAEEGALRLRRALGLRARVRARAADRPRRARAEVGEEEAQAAVVRGRRAPRRGLRGRRAARARRSTSTSRTSSPRCSRSRRSSGCARQRTPPSWRCRRRWRHGTSASTAVARTMVVLSSAQAEVWFTKPPCYVVPDVAADEELGAAVVQSIQSVSLSASPPTDDERDAWERRDPRSPVGVKDWATLERNAEACPHLLSMAAAGSSTG